MKIISIHSIHGTFIGFITKKIMQHGYMKKKKKKKQQNKKKHVNEDKTQKSKKKRCLVRISIKKKRRAGMLSLHIITFPQEYVGALRSNINKTKHQILIRHKYV